MGVAVATEPIRMGVQFPENTMEAHVMDVLTLDDGDGRTELAGDLFAGDTGLLEAEAGAEEAPTRDDQWGIFRAPSPAIDIPAEEVTAFLDASAALDRALGGTPGAVKRTLGVVAEMVEGELPVSLRGVADRLAAMQAELVAAVEDIAAAPVKLPDSVPSRKDIEIAELRMASACEMAGVLTETARLMTAELVPTAGSGTTLATVRATIRSRADDLTGLRADVAVKMAVARS